MLNNLLNPNMWWVRKPTCIFMMNPTNGNPVPCTCLGVKTEFWGKIPELSDRKPVLPECEYSIFAAGCSAIC